jgi:hypothetical protein
MATVEETTQKVQRILVDSFNDVRLRTNGFALEVGSTAAFVEVQAWTPDKDGNPRSLVYVWAPLGRDVAPSDELFHWAATDGQQFRLGGVTVIENKDAKTCFLQFDYTILGDYLDPAELVSAVAAVMYTADDIDETVHTRFGGKRYTDPSDPPPEPPPAPSEPPTPPAAT